MFNTEVYLVEFECLLNWCKETGRNTDAYTNFEKNMGTWFVYEYHFVFIYVDFFTIIYLK